MPEEEDMIRAIERALQKKIDRRTVAGFDYNRMSDEVLEIPLAERIAEIRARKRQDRERATARERGEIAPRRQPHRRRRA
jgi:ATP-dependent RNA helicase RhlE